MIVIDTNIFLETALGQDKADECKTLLNAVSEGKVEAAVTHFSLHAVAAILGRGSEIGKFLQAIERSRGLHVHDTSIQDEVTVSRLSDKIRRDFDDSLQYFIATEIGAECIVSFDKDFDNLDIPRREPKAILKQEPVSEDARAHSNLENH